MTISESDEENDVKHLEKNERKISKEKQRKELSFSKKNLFD